MLLMGISASSSAEGVSANGEPEIKPEKESHKKSNQKTKKKTNNPIQLLYYTTV